MSYFSIQKNKELTIKYPFLIPRNVFSDEVFENYNYAYTLLNSMPIGWLNTFGEPMCEEIKNELIKINKLNDFRIEDIKEKYGTLRIETNFTTEGLEKIFKKYEELSMLTCIHCGRPTKYITKDWINYICEECAKKHTSCEKLTSNDIPSYVTYVNDDVVTVDAVYRDRMLEQWK